MPSGRLGQRRGSTGKELFLISEKVFAGKHVDKHIHDKRIELAAPLSFDLVYGTVDTPCLFIRPLVRERIEHVCDRDDSS